MMYRFNPDLFNPQQREAVLHGDGPMLVLAGAGSGKTRIIAHRVAHLIDIRQIAPEQIVAVSFTNKAARELRGRVAELVGKEKANRCHLSTFHALGADILRSHIGRLGWKLPFAIIGNDEQIGIIRGILKDLHLQGSNFAPEDMLNFVSRVKTAHAAPMSLPGMRWNPQGRTLAKIFDHYQIVRKSMNAVDFDDMIALPVDIFESFPEVLTAYQNAWRYLLVDEYQDTNELQFKLLQLLCGNRANLMVVGDDDQSIYAFRGANSKHILEFPTLFSDVQVVALEQNYRSSQIILDAANAVIAKNNARHQKNLWSETKSGEKIRAFSCATPEEEAAFVVDEIIAQRAAKNLEYSDFAILYRTNPQARLFEEKLIEKCLPYKIVGGSKFYDQSEIRDIIFYLRAAFSFNDELALRRIINTPRRGIAAASLSRIDNYAKTHQVPFFDAVCAEAESGELSPSAQLKLREFIQIMKQFSARFHEPNGSMARTLTELLDAIHYKAYIQSACNSDEVARRKRENIDELLGALAGYERKNPGDLQGFLQLVAIEPPQKNDSDTMPNEITLMTLHAAKGLEFPAVYIVGCEENFIPHANSLKEPELSEERRLFYVGITRAKQFLTLTRARTRRKLYETIDVEPSRFLKDIPQNTICAEDATPSAAAQKLKAEQDERNRKYLDRIRDMLRKPGV